jgi:predicted glycosyltransferase
MTFLDALPFIAPHTSLAFLIVTGPSITQEHYETIVARAMNLPVQVRRSCEDAAHLIHHAEAVVSLAGYNTMCEILLTKKKALVLPRPTQTAEQRIRAERFAALGLVRMLDPLKVTPQSVATGLLELLGAEGIPNPGRIPSLDGAQRIAALLLEYRPSTAFGTTAA